MVIEYGKPETERVILIGLATDSRRRPEVAESLEELAQLTLSAGAQVIGQRIQVKPHPNPATYVGSGLVDELKIQLQELNGNCVIFDDSLSPAQQRNLEAALDVKVIDRSILILDIFATRARTAAARLQVELAQLEYTLPRLTGAWVHFSRQYGGIGAKGPGETQLEVDRRSIRTKISHLKEKLKKLSTQRHMQRSSRQELFKVALVGYTNAGKSTLFNLLAKAEVRSADQLFTTLDSTTRLMAIEHPKQIVLSDTVGFIRKLPHQLVESFKSTLEEVKQADLLLHIIDASDPRLDERILHTREILHDIGADEIDYLMVYNKIDLCPDFLIPPSNGHRSVAVSAHKRTGLAELKAEIVTHADRYLQVRQSR